MLFITVRKSVLRANIFVSYPSDTLNKTTQHLTEMLSTPRSLMLRTNFSTMTSRSMSGIVGKHICVIWYVLRLPSLTHILMSLLHIASSVRRLVVIITSTFAEMLRRARARVIVTFISQWNQNPREQKIASLMHYFGKGRDSRYVIVIENPCTCADFLSRTHTREQQEYLPNATQSVLAKNTNRTQTLCWKAAAIHTSGTASFLCSINL